jgi:hypothetical protein
MTLPPMTRFAKNSSDDDDDAHKVPNPAGT